MRILAACSMGGAGHLNPLLPFLDPVNAMVVGPPSLEAMVAGAGLPFFPGDEPPEADVAPIREKLPVVSPAEAVVLGNRELFGRMAAGAMLPHVERACEEFRPDVILREPCEYASAMIAARRGIPVAQVAISPAQGEWNSIDAAAPVLEEYATGLADRIRRAPYVSRFPASMDPSPFEATIRYREPVGRRPSPAASGPTVYASFGTVLGYMSIAGEAFATLLDALAGLEVPAVMTTGRNFDHGSLKPPPHVKVLPWVDQADVLGSAKVVVCHGGSGTVLGALAAGVPVVAVPFFADQFSNARMVSDRGCGREVGIAGGAAALCEEIGRVLSDPSYLSAASEVAEEMASYPPATEALLTGIGASNVR